MELDHLRTRIAEAPNLRALARRAQVSVMTLQRIRDGRSSPTFRTAEKILQALAQLRQ